MSYESRSVKIGSVVWSREGDEQKLGSQKRKTNTRSAEMGDRLATIDMDRKLGGSASFWGS